MKAALLGVALALAGCAAQPGWNGQRGYGGSGDYGYDLAANRSEARQYRAQAAAAYPIPGPPDDPWGPYIREAAARFAFPENWIREVMRQESGGRLYAADGSLITSGAGAMGLMQVMPQTYDLLRPRLGLGADAYAPRDNILAGTAYLREMYDRFGSPLFLAAYNAGPDRVSFYLSGAKILPDETEDYVARIAPRLGPATVAMAAAPALPGGLAPGRVVSSGGVVSAGGDWGLQLGAFTDADSARQTAEAAGAELPGTRPEVSPGPGGLYRARVIGLSADDAQAACQDLAQRGRPCLAVPGI
ncbi:lytic transglycosylase domain-containing protein [Roseomonas sp. 18066]|uniref:lytic transglycosylase domain-containing protein n=1 Tax=Roseomonas sp. 18066 TaxID=2681412 RepID=UPI00135C4E81|nr:lytic transglycosylase domain-containing protein [Roseomonas sp. 18066]